MDAGTTAMEGGPSSEQKWVLSRLDGEHRDVFDHRAELLAYPKDL